MSCLLNTAKREVSKTCKTSLKCLLWCQVFRKRDYVLPVTDNAFVWKYSEIAGSPKDWILVSGPPYEIVYPVTLGSLTLLWRFLQHKTLATPVPQAGWSEPASAPSCYLWEHFNNHYIITDFRVSRGSASLDVMKALLSSSNITWKFPWGILVDSQLS